jgi:hypothetical protein
LLVELRVVVTVEPTERHGRRPLSPTQVDRLVALRKQIEAAVDGVLERAVPAAPERRSPTT